MTKIHDELVAHLTKVLDKSGLAGADGMIAAEHNEAALEVIRVETGMRQPYSLWIDDDAGKPGMEAWRSPPVYDPNDPLSVVLKDDDWKVAHSTDEAIAIVTEFGIPYCIDFDHDLGLLPKNDSRGIFDTSILFLKWLYDTYPNAIDSIAVYNIHSKNVEGARDIEAFLSSWKRSRSLP